MELLSIINYNATTCNIQNMLRIIVAGVVRATMQYIHSKKKKLTYSHHHKAFQAFFSAFVVTMNKWNGLFYYIYYIKFETVSNDGQFACKWNQILYTRIHIFHIFYSNLIIILNNECSLSLPKHLICWWKNAYISIDVVRLTAAWINRNYDNLHFIFYRTKALLRQI